MLLVSWSSYIVNISTYDGLKVGEVAFGPLAPYISRSLQRTMSLADLHRSAFEIPSVGREWALQTEDCLREAMNAVESPRLRLMLHDLCNRPPDPRTVTAALLLLREKKCTQKPEKREESSAEDEAVEVDGSTHEVNFRSRDEEDSESEVDVADREEEEDTASSDDQSKEGSSGDVDSRPTKLSDDENDVLSCRRADEEDSDECDLSSSGSESRTTARTIGNKISEEKIEAESSVRSIRRIAPAEGGIQYDVDSSDGE